MHYNRVMKKTSLVLLVLFIISTAFAGAFIDFFHARSENGQVLLEWKTSTEQSIKSFKIERKTVDGEFMEIASIQPQGNNSFYTFVDENALKTADVIYIYRLKIVDNNEQFSHSKEVSVSHSISGVKRTWGSIKAMFR